MWRLRKPISLLALFLLLLPAVFAQSSSLNAPSIEKLKEILAKYETSIAVLKARIAELETQLELSVTTSNNLAQDLPMLRKTLESLESDYAKLKEYSEAFQIQLEESKRQTENSLNLLSLSVAEIQIENTVLKFGGIAVLILVLIDVILSIFK